MLKIVYEDDALLVIDKPPDLVVDRSSSQKEGLTLEDILANQYGLNLERSGIVHRLDKDTSGLLVVAKTEHAQKELRTQFKNHTTCKEYLCLVHGVIEKSGKIVESIKRNPLNNERFVVMQGGREAVTLYEVIESLTMSSLLMKKIFTKNDFKKLPLMNYGQFSLLRCRPITGRTHQIRVHLKYINHPIVGDNRYGGRKTVRYDLLWCPRQFLHAVQLELIHPITKKKVTFSSQLPKDLEKVLSLLKETV